MRQAPTGIAIKLNDDPPVEKRFVRGDIDQDGVITDGVAVLQHLFGPGDPVRYLNHTKAFWNQVDKVLPDYRDRKEWLRLNGAGMNL